MTRAMYELMDSLYGIHNVGVDLFCCVHIAFRQNDSLLDDVRRVSHGRACLAGKTPTATQT